MKTLAALVFLISLSCFAKTEEKVNREGTRYWVTDMTAPKSCSELQKLAEAEGKNLCFESTLDESQCKVTRSTKEVLKYKAWVPCTISPLCDYKEVSKTQCRVKVYTVAK